MDKSSGTSSGPAITVSLSPVPPVEQQKHIVNRPHDWFSKKGWELQTPPASFATHAGWSNQDVDVTPPEWRNWRAYNYLFLWLADGANVGTMQQAASVVAFGLSWREALAAIAIGNIVIAAAVTLNGVIGSRHRIPFSIASRASMGFYFSYFAVFSRFVLALIYFGTNTFIGASCMLIMLEAIWPSLKNLPNHLPPPAGVASNKMIAYFVFWALQFPLVMIHPRKMRWLFAVKSACAIVASFALLGWAVHAAGGGGPIFAKHTTLKGSSLSWAWVAGLNVAISGKTTLAINIARRPVPVVSRADVQPDLTRYSRTPAAAYWQALWIPLIYFLFSLIGVVVASAGQEIYGTLLWDPTSIIARWTNRAAAFFCAAAFGLATLGTNISTNSIAASNDLAFMFPKYVDLQRGAFVTALLGGWATAPWKIQASATALTTFLSGYVIVLAPIVAIMITDYWLVRRGHLHIPALYQNKGIYRYRGGVNWRAAATLAIVIPINLPGLIHAINPKVHIGNYAYFYKASWLTAFFISASVFYLLNLLKPPTGTLVQETVESVGEVYVVDVQQEDEWASAPAYDKASA